MRCWQCPASGQGLVRAPVMVAGDAGEPSGKLRHDLHGRCLWRKSRAGAGLGEGQFFFLFARSMLRVTSIEIM